MAQICNPAARSVQKNVLKDCGLLQNVSDFAPFNSFHPWLLGSLTTFTLTIRIISFQRDKNKVTVWIILVLVLFKMEYYDLSLNDLNLIRFYESRGDFFDFL
jgi:hypothetical protein